MKRHKELIESGKGTATLIEAQKTREIAELQYHEQSDYETKRRLTAVIEKLDPLSKTVLASFIIDEVRNMTSANVLYFYCKHDQERKKTLTEIVRAMLAQLARKDPTVASYIHEEIISSKGELSQRMIIDDIGPKSFAGQEKLSVILDGLDECNAEEAEEILDWFMLVQKRHKEGHGGQVNILFMGQRTDLLQQRLSTAAQISLEASKHKEDVTLYVEREAHKLQGEFELSHTIRFQIIKRVAETANELEPATFPVDLKDAYERVVATIFRKGPQQAAAKHILEWIICAKRPLKWREVQATFFLDPVEGKADYNNSRRRKSCKAICGSLVDLQQHTSSLQSDATLSLVHETARGYLVEKGLVNISLRDANIALFNLQYLMSKPFQTLKSDDIRSNTSSGYYAMLDYATLHWDDHIRSVLKAGGDSDLRSELQQLLQQELRTFLAHYDITTMTSKGALNDKEDLQSPHEIVKMRNEWLYLEQRTSTIRDRIESIMTDSQTEQDHLQLMRNIYGSLRFKCPKIGCQHFTNGFHTASQRKEHFARHSRPFNCSETTCPSFIIGFESANQLLRHKARSHKNDADKIMFPKAQHTQDTFLKALRWGDVGAVEGFLTAGAGIDDPVRDHYETPLFLATKYNRLDICRLLLQHGATLKEHGLKNYPLREAFEKNKDAIFDLFLNTRVGEYHDFSRLKTPSSETAVFDVLRDSAIGIECAKKLNLAQWFSNALERQDEPLFRWLIEVVGCDNLVDSSRRTALHQASMSGVLAAVKMLLSRPSVNVTARHASGYSPLDYALQNGHAAVVRELLGSKGIEVGINPGALSTVIHKNDVKCMELLLQSESVDVNPTFFGHTSMVLQLLSVEGIDVNCQDQEGKSPLWVAATADHAEILNILLAQPAVNLDALNEGDSNGCTPLHTAAEHGRDNIVQILLSCPNVHVNARNMRDRTPLHSAAAGDLGGHADVVKRLLLDDRGEHDPVDMYGYTPLTVAADRGHEKVVRILLDSDRVNPIHADNFGEIPITRAQKSGHTRTVEMLRGRSCTPAALFAAASTANQQIVDLILESRKIDPNARFNDGYSVIELAILEGHRSIVQHFRDSGTVDVARLSVQDRLAFENADQMPMPLCAGNHSMQLSDVSQSALPRDERMLPPALAKPLEICAIGLELAQKWTKKYQVLCQTESENPALVDYNH
ncbi:uncharacterized protein KY384_005092 [Bacidia gigantensis]|uniref:uncharacterized protein n=1 Tax=Bacidia gigantensis TaxID=2732470 RepID=UPI001D055FBF|nr:uncharacterized protein KY384_005092 [Bacidia gigantensis]KAG8530589.1 hypothetical protein KY384_005092 [Bacidia gigantensis]